MKLFKKIRKLFSRKPKVWVENQYRLVPAFTWQGETYYMHEDPLNVATGRGLMAMVFLEEMLMRCDRSYLTQHIKATEAIFSDPKKINLPGLIKLNSMLKERLNFLVALPDHVYTMASVVFFTKEESPFRYDKAFNEKKIAAWKEAPGMYDFFLKTPLKTLLPFLTLPESNSHDYLRVVEKINQHHLSQVGELLSSNPSPQGMRN